MEVGGLKGVVDSHDHVLVGLVGDVRHGLDVDQLQGRVGRGLDPHQFGVGTNGGCNLQNNLYFKIF